METQFKTNVKYGVECIDDTIIINSVPEEADSSPVSVAAVKRGTEFLNECLRDFDAFTMKYAGYLIGLGERCVPYKEASFWAIPLPDGFYLYFNTVEKKPTKVCFASTKDFIYE